MGTPNVANSDWTVMYPIMLDSTEEFVFSHVIKFTVEENGFIGFADVTVRVIRLSVGDGAKELECLMQPLEVIM